MTTRHAPTRTQANLARFPFDPARMPFFYGWPVLVFGTLGVVMSVPGQTIGVSVFTDFLIEAHGLSRSTLSLAYLVGTIGSALVLSRAGRVYDRFGGRWVSAAAALVLAIVLVGLSVSPEISRAVGDLAQVGGASAIAFIVMTVGFFFLRFSGQGMLTLASRNMVMEWFEQRRGMANAVLGIAVAFGFSSAPRVLEVLIQHGGWRWAWRTMAAVVTGFAVFAFLTFRARPEDHGLVPDGGMSAKSRRTHPETHGTRSFTLPEARRTFAFWVFASSTVMSGLFMTAFTFHIVSIFGDAGMDRSRAVTIFLPMAVVAVAFEFVGSWLSDYVKLKFLAMVQSGGMVVASAALAGLADGGRVSVLILGMGMMQGMFGITSSVVWPRFFGRQHLGAISGFAMALVVAGTAIGPYLFSFARDLRGSYGPAAALCAVIGLALLGAAARADRPR